MKSDIYQRTEWVTEHWGLRHWDLILANFLGRFTLGKWAHCEESLTHIYSVRIKWYIVTGGPNLE